jgi:hypothetical protein
VSLADLLPDFRRWLRSGGRLTFRGVSIVVFVVALGMIAFVTATASSVLAVTLGTFVLFFMLKGALPDERIDEFTTDLMTGEVGERWWTRFTTALASLRRRFKR